MAAAPAAIAPGTMPDLLPWRPLVPTGFLPHNDFQTSRASGSAAIVRLSRLAQEDYMHTEGLSHTRFDVYRTVTDSIVAAIEAGAGEFIMPWHGQGADIAKPQNAHTAGADAALQ